MRSDFVGRARELAQLLDGVRSAAAGHGRVVFLAGEAGIGKTRLLEEIVARARDDGLLVLSGACAETGAVPYAPFREALDTYLRTDEGATWRQELGADAAVVARIVPAARDWVPSPGEKSAALSSDEERLRLLDTLTRFLTSLAARRTLVLVLDDLHWADEGTIALFRHVGRSVSGHSLLVLGAYRETEIAEGERLADAIAILRRQPGFERISLAGLETRETAAVLSALMAKREGVEGRAIDDALVQVIDDEAKGNPFFAHSLFLHLVEDGKVRVVDGRWRATESTDDIGLPESVRHVLSKRLLRLSSEARRFLTVAAAVGATFRFDVVARVAELSEEDALGAVDDALTARLIEGSSSPDTYRFAHALIQQTLYQAMNPSRRVRLHRRVAEGMESVYGDWIGEHGAQIATHYHLSRTVPGAQRGVVFALDAATRATATAFHAEASSFLRQALDLLPGADPRRIEVLERLGMALSLSGEADAAVAVCEETAPLIDEHRGRDASADFLAEASRTLFEAGFPRAARRLALRGLSYLHRERRDATWVRLVSAEIAQREIEDVAHPGLIVDTPARGEVQRVAAGLDFSEREQTFLAMNGFRNPTSRAELLAQFGDQPDWLMHGGGDLRRAAHLWRIRAAASTRDGRLADAVTCWSHRARCLNALGDLQGGRDAIEQALSLAGRFEPDSLPFASLGMVRCDLVIAVDEGHDEVSHGLATFLRDADPEHAWAASSFRALAAAVHARVGRSAEAIDLLDGVIPAVKHAPGWARGYPPMVCNAAAALWSMHETAHIEVLEAALRNKVLPADLRYPMHDARLSMARLCALQQRSDEAREWFATAREVLDEQGALPLRAITDYDEALMLSRAPAPAVDDRAVGLLDVALAQFRAIGMSGWIARAEALAEELRHPTSVVRKHAQAAAARGASPRRVHATLRSEGEFWTIVYEGKLFRLKNSSGLSSLAALLRRPGRDIPATDLVRIAADSEETQSTAGAEPDSLTQRRDLGDLGEILDPQARAAYRKRVEEIRAELEEAVSFNDAGRAERLRSELESLMRELSRAIGLRGRSRVAGSHVERARVNVTRSISRTLKVIAAQHPGLGEHLRRTIRTGTLCCYAPDPNALIEWNE